MSRQRGWSRPRRGDGTAGPHTNQAHKFRDEITVPDRLNTALTRSLDRDLGLDRDDGLEL